MTIVAMSFRLFFSHSFTALVAILNFIQFTTIANQVIQICLIGIDVCACVDIVTFNVDLQVEINN